MNCVHSTSRMHLGPLPTHRTTFTSSSELNLDSRNTTMSSAKDHLQVPNQDSLEEIDLNNKKIDKGKGKEIDHYEPQHQYQEPSEEVMQQLNLPNSSTHRADSSNPPSVDHESAAEYTTTGRYGGTVSKLGMAKAAGRRLFGHMKRSEMPWTQWYCCAVVNSKTGERVRGHCYEMRG